MPRTWPSLLAGCGLSCLTWMLTMSASPRVGRPGGVERCRLDSGWRAGGAAGDQSRGTGVDHRWGPVVAGRNTARSVKLAIGGDALEVSGVSSAEQDRLIDLWVSRHAAGP